MPYKLDIAVIWHMHQPYYKDLASGEYLLPWVRLHAIKDYYDMPLLLDDFKGIRQTFNLVPSLLIQLEDYATGEGTDLFLEVSRKPAADLTETEKGFILSNFFHANRENMIRPIPRYWKLLHKRGLDFNSGSAGDLSGDVIFFRTGKTSSVIRNDDDTSSGGNFIYTFTWSGANATIVETADDTSDITGTVYWYR